MERAEELVYYLQELASRYQKIFHGNAQTLYKLKEVICFIRDLDFALTIKKMKRSKTLEEFLGYVEEFA